VGNNSAPKGLLRMGKWGQKILGNRLTNRLRVPKRGKLSECLKKGLSYHQKGLPGIGEEGGGPQVANERIPGCGNTSRGAHGWSRTTHEVAMEAVVGEEVASKAEPIDCCPQADNAQLPQTVFAEKLRARKAKTEDCNGKGGDTRSFSSSKRKGRKNTDSTVLQKKSGSNPRTRLEKPCDYVIWKEHHLRDHVVLMEKDTNGWK